MKHAYSLLGKKDLAAASIPKSPFVDKRARGTALIISGSDSYHGSPVLSSLAALRVGAGYVKLYVPKSIIKPVRALSPNIIVHSLGDKTIKFNAEILKEIKRADAIAIGMGIGRGKKTLMSAEKIISHAISLNKTIIVDADAIYALKKLRKNYASAGRIIATPHDHEFFGLTGTKPQKSNLGARISCAAECARKLKIIMVLKGHNSIVTDGKRVKVGRSRSSALATMGTGDVLSGIICGYAATGSDAFDAAAAGVYLHSFIGDMLAKTGGNHIIATDVLNAIPAAIKKFDKRKRSSRWNT